jgi:hypothetical protein
VAASPGAPAGQALLLLTQGTDGAELRLVRPGLGSVALPVPDPSTTAVAPMGDSSLVALLADGRAFVAPDGPGGLLASSGWRPLDLRRVGALPPGTLVLGAAASPDGGRIAAIARPPHAESPSALLVVDPGERTAVGWPLPDESLGSAPAWLDDDRAAVVQRGRAGRTFVAIVDVATGQVVDRIPLRALAFGTSGDGQTAVVLGDESRLAVGPAAKVLELRLVPDRGPAGRPGDVIRAGIALDRSGDRLAAIVEDVAGVGQIATFGRAGEAWEPGARIATPSGDGGGQVVWLP